MTLNSSGDGPLIPASSFPDNPPIGSSMDPFYLPSSANPPSAKALETEMENLKMGLQEKKLAKLSLGISIASFVLGGVLTVGGIVAGIVGAATLPMLGAGVIVLCLAMLVVGIGFTLLAGGVIFKITHMTMLESANEYLQNSKSD